MRPGSDLATAAQDLPRGKLHALRGGFRNGIACIVLDADRGFSDNPWLYASPKWEWHLSESDDRRLD